MRVDAVFEKNATTLYVNGQKSASMESEYKLTDILGDSSILQIGKANWGSGEYFKGWLDNFRILDRALTAEEVELSAHAFLMAQPLIGEALVGQIVDKPYESSGMDDHTAVSTKIDEKTLRSVPGFWLGSDLSEVKLTLELTFPGYHASVGRE